MQIIVSPQIQTLSSAEARALLDQPAQDGNREAFLQAIVGTMTDEEAEEMERVIDAACERIDD